MKKQNKSNVLNFTKTNIARLDNFTANNVKGGTATLTPVTIPVVVCAGTLDPNPKTETDSKSPC